MNNQRLKYVSRNEFRTRYYLWALEDGCREVQQKFPFISRVKSTWALEFLTFMEQLSLEQQLTYENALVKRMFQSILEDQDKLLTPDEEALYKHFSKESKLISRRLYTQGKLDTRDIKVNSKKLRKVLEGSLSQLFDKVFESDGNNRFLYRSVIEPWAIETAIFLGGRAKLNYMQVIKSTNQEPMSCEPLAVVDVFQWLGVGCIDWNLMTDEDALLAAESSALFCSHFINAAPNLLVNISPDLTPSEAQSCENLS